MKILLHILVFLLGFSPVLRAESHLMFEKANQLYHNRLYDSAAGLYQQMINDGYVHPDLFYNAGNAYYRSNRIGMAIWCYRKAQLLHGDKATDDNLALAKRRIREPLNEVPEIFFVRWFRAAYGLFSLNAWALLALGLFLTAMLLLSLRLLQTRIPFPRRLPAVLFVFGFIALLMTGVRYWLQTYRYHGILVGNRIEFRSRDGGGETIRLSEGLEAVHLGRVKGGLLVRLPDGRVGEIPSTSFKRL